MRLILDKGLSCLSLFKTGELEFGGQLILCCFNIALYIYQDKYNIEVDWVFHLISIIIIDNDAEDYFFVLFFFLVAVIYHCHYHHKG